MNKYDTPDWRADANCATTSPEIFFPEKGGSSYAARRVCANCTVQTQCLAYALANEPEFGWYAGLSPADRRTLKQVVA